MQNYIEILVQPVKHYPLVHEPQNDPSPKYYIASLL